MMFVFGAGASFDSDPEARQGDGDPINGFDFRPPPATGLFAPNNGIGQETIAAFPRAASLLMRLKPGAGQPVTRPCSSPARR